MAKKPTLKRAVKEAKSQGVPRERFANWLMVQYCLKTYIAEELDKLSEECGMTERLRKAYDDLP